MPEHLPLEKGPRADEPEKGFPPRRVEERELEKIFYGKDSVVQCTPDGKCEVRDASGTLIYYEDQGAIANVLKRWSDSLTGERRREELNSQVPVEALDPKLQEDLKEIVMNLELRKRGEARDSS